MLIAIIEFDVSADKRPEALVFLENEAKIIRKMDGNLNYQNLEDPQSTTRIVILQEWQDAASFAAYKETEVFANSGKTIVPMMVSKPSSRAFAANLVTA